MFQSSKSLVSLFVRDCTCVVCLCRVFGACNSVLPNPRRCIYRPDHHLRFAAVWIIASQPQDQHGDVQMPRLAERRFLHNSSFEFHSIVHCSLSQVRIVYVNKLSRHAARTKLKGLLEPRSRAPEGLHSFAAAELPCWLNELD